MLFDIYFKEFINIWLNSCPFSGHDYIYLESFRNIPKDIYKCCISTTQRTKRRVIVYVHSALQY